MLELEMDVAGIFGLVADGLAPEIITRFRRKAHKQALEEWVQRRGFPGLGARFSSNHMAALGLSERNPAYVKRVLRAWGKYLPYTSPVRRGKVHMRDLVRSEAGHRIANKNATEVVRTTLFLSGARVLNLLTGDKAKYRREFLRIASSFGRVDREWIETRANELFMEALNARIDAQAKKTLRARNRLTRLLAA